MASWKTLSALRHMVLPKLSTLKRWERSSKSLSMINLSGSRYLLPKRRWMNSPTCTIACLLLKPHQRMPLLLKAEHHSFLKMSVKQLREILCSSIVTRKSKEGLKWPSAYLRGSLKAQFLFLLSFSIPWFKSSLTHSNGDNSLICSRASPKETVLQNKRRSTIWRRTFSIVSSLKPVANWKSRLKDLRTTSLVQPHVLRLDSKKSRRVVKLLKVPSKTQLLPQLLKSGPEGGAILHQGLLSLKKMRS